MVAFISINILDNVSVSVQERIVPDLIDSIVFCLQVGTMENVMINWRIILDYLKFFFFYTVL